MSPWQKQATVFCLSSCVVMQNFYQGKRYDSRIINSTALPKGAEFIRSKTWRIPYLRTLSKAINILLAIKKELHDPSSSKQNGRATRSLTETMERTKKSCPEILVVRNVVHKCWSTLIEEQSELDVNRPETIP